MITFHSGQRYFQLTGSGFSYLLGVSPNGDLHHLHWGKPLSSSGLKKLLGEWKERAIETDHHIGRESQYREFPDFGHNDLRTPAFQLEHRDGYRISEFHYDSFQILPGKPDFGPGPLARGRQAEGQALGVPGRGTKFIESQIGPGPSSRTEESDQAQTLKILLKDRLHKLEMNLYYTLYPSRGLLVRRTILRNRGTKPVSILKLASASLDLPPAPLTRGPHAEGQALEVPGLGTKSTESQTGPGAWHLVRFPGRWAKERQMREGPLQEGTLRLESRRGISSHEMNPFVMITRGPASEDQGEVYGFALATSGNWLVETELFRDQSLRMNAGLNDFDFKWQLEPGKAFVSPECVLAYSASGYSGLSFQLHRFIRERVIGGYWRDKARPMLINNWEATYFKFDHDRILKIAKAGKEAGLELFVLDDGWFGRRDDDTTSLGDWIVDKRKLPRGLRGLSDDIHGLGMKFGLWIEPEMISPKSLLYRKHPDWCLHVPERRRRMARSQLVLDMSRPEIRDYLFEAISKALEEARVDYVKWDMNRSLSEVGNEVLPPNRQGELYFRYVMGVYDLMDRLNRRFPRVLFEGCAGGGARFDLGLLNYHPQIWTSDNTDGLDRLFIQYSTSFCYPPLAMGAHISSVPNHITHRSMSLKWRALVAMSGNFGVEADITKWSPRNRKALAHYIKLYKEIRPIVQFGDFYRLENPHESNRASWMFVSPDQREALVFVFQVKPPEVGEKVKGFRLKGLKANLTYEIYEEGQPLSGKNLLKDGWLPKAFKNPRQSFSCELYRIRATR